jgi:hypothetical protein
VNFICIYMSYQSIIRRFIRANCSLLLSVHLCKEWSHIPVPFICLSQKLTRVLKYINSLYLCNYFINFAHFWKRCSLDLNMQKAMITLWLMLVGSEFRCYLINTFISYQSIIRGFYKANWSLLLSPDRVIMYSGAMWLQHKQYILYLFTLDDINEILINVWQSGALIYNIR